VGQEPFFRDIASASSKVFGYVPENIYELKTFAESHTIREEYCIIERV
jgi:hypothetical protein